MSGVYTNLAKKRAEQSKEQETLAAVPPPPAKPAVHAAQHTAETRKPRKLVSQETRKLGNGVTPTTEPQGFDLNIEPYKKGTFLFTNEELYAVDDVKKDLKRRLDLSSTQYDIVRAAVHIITEDYRKHGADSLIVQRLKTKKAR
jgi:hypothetical protein